MLVHVGCRWVDYPGDFAEVLDYENIRSAIETCHDSVYSDFDDSTRPLLANGDSG